MPPVNSKYKCDVSDCGVICSRADHLRNHKRSIHDKIRYKCTKCEKTYSDPSALRKHVRHKHAVAVVEKAADVLAQMSTIADAAVLTNGKPVDAVASVLNEKPVDAVAAVLTNGKPVDAIASVLTEKSVDAVASDEKILFPFDNILLPIENDEMPLADFDDAVDDMLTADVDFDDMLPVGIDVIPRNDVAKPLRELDASFSLNIDSVHNVPKASNGADAIPQDENVNVRSNYGPRRLLSMELPPTNSIVLGYGARLDALQLYVVQRAFDLQSPDIGVPACRVFGYRSWYWREFGEVCQLEERCIPCRLSFGSATKLMEHLNEYHI